MIVECKKCHCDNDLTALNVNVGHVFDCEDCNEPLRALNQGGKVVGVPVSDIPRPTLPKMPENGPGARAPWEEHRKQRTEPKPGHHRTEEKPKHEQKLDKESRTRHP